MSYADPEGLRFTDGRTNRAMLRRTTRPHEHREAGSNEA